MCTNAVKTAASLMQAIEPTLKSLLMYANVINTPEGQAAIDAYNAALAAVQGWKQGTATQNVLQIIGDFQEVFNALPLQSNVMQLANIILAGVETVIGVITANSPAPAAAHMMAAEEQASHEEVQAMHAEAVIAHTTGKVQTLVPGFQRSIWKKPEKQYKDTWNKAVEEGKFPESLKAA